MNVRHKEMEWFDMAQKRRYSEGELVDRIRHAILAGKYKPREHLVEMELSEQYQVSRTPIREALRQLETMGLVEHEKNRGTVVADIDLDTIHEMQQVRAGLEGMIARLAAERMTDEDVLKLEQYVDNMEKAYEKLSIEDFTENNDAFHDYIEHCSANKYLVDEEMRILRKTVHQPCHTWTALGDVQRTMNGHREILSALQQRDPRAAQIAATEHVLNAIKNQKRFLE